MPTMADNSGVTLRIGETVNLELAIVRGILKLAKRWRLISDQVRPLPVRRCVGRALSDDEKLRLLKAAAKKPEWQLARLAMTLALTTTMRSCEIKGLRWRDVNFTEQTVTIRQSKTAAGHRVIPLNTDARTAVLELWHRAKANSQMWPGPKGTWQKLKGRKAVFLGDLGSIRNGSKGGS